MKVGPPRLEDYRARGLKGICKEGLPRPLSLSPRVPLPFKK
jgi:hypothetical protein